MLRGVDYTALLQKLGVDIASFGHFTDTGSPDYRLSEGQRAQLRRLGLIRKDGFTGWTAIKKYHWTQTFAARQVVKIKHTYSPKTGYGLLEPGLASGAQSRKASPEAQEFKNAVRTSCADLALQKTLIEQARKQDGEYVASKWVDYILTSANSWKTPIKDFELIVEPPKPEPFDKEDTLVNELLLERPGDPARCG